MAIHLSHQLRHFGVTEANHPDTGEHGVAIFSKDGKCHWLFTDPDQLDFIAGEIRRASSRLCEQKKGATVHDLAPKRQIEIIGKRLIPEL